MSPCGQPGEGLNGGRVVFADQHGALLLVISDGGAFGEELGSGEHREAGTWAARVQGQPSIQRRSLAWQPPRPRFLGGGVDERR